MSSKNYLSGPESYREFRETGPWTDEVAVGVTMNQLCAETASKMASFSFRLKYSLIFPLNLSRKGVARICTHQPTLIMNGGSVSCIYVASQSPRSNAVEGSFEKNARLLTVVKSHLHDTLCQLSSGHPIPQEPKGRKEAGGGGDLSRTLHLRNSRSLLLCRLPRRINMPPQVNISLFPKPITVNATILNTAIYNIYSSKASRSFLK